MPAPPKSTRRRPAQPVIYRSTSLERDQAVASGRGRPFILTGCARQAIGRIVGGISGSNSPRAWTLTGPFGTGKSSFCLFLSRLLAPASQPGANEARQLLHDSQASLASIVRASGVGQQGLVPVLVTANREPLPVALARGFAAALRLSPTRRAQRLAKGIEEGATGTRDPIGLVEQAVECLVSEDESIGVLLIIDEFGKLLEYASAQPSKSDVYVLQRLAEYAVRAHNPLLVISVLHQDFSGYTRDLAQEDRQEWEKVRGRFEDIAFEQSADDILRLLAQAMAIHALGARPQPHDARDRFESLCEHAWAVNVAPSGLDLGTGRGLLSACYPLHPCATLLLGPIFKRFGQNERSAFSFLISGEPHALPDFVAKSPEGELYSLVHLYDYLIGAFGDSLLRSKDGKRWAEAFNVESQHTDLSQGELKVLRAIALLGIVGRWNGIAPTLEVVKYALSPAMLSAEVDEGIRSLSAKSAVVYRRFNKSYSLWEGSDIDVEALVAHAQSRIARDASSVQLLRSHFSLRPLVARRHSFQSGTLRFFDVVFASLSTLKDVVAAFDKAGEKTKADGLIVVLLPEARGGPTARLDASISAVASRPDTILCVAGNAREVDSLARELAAVRSVRSETLDLQHDATARRELATRENDIWRRLEQAVAQVMAPPRPGLPRTRWYRLGVEQNMGTSRALNELLSTVCDELFVSAPAIQNEIINRRELSSSAAAAQGKLIARMLQDGDKEGLGIEGNPPERSIYLSVLRALNLHQAHGNHWSFAASEKSIRPNAQPVYRAMKAFFRRAESEPRNLDQLFSLLRRPPYGLRDGVIPILVCAALIGNEADVAVYQDGAFLPQLTAAVFEKLVKEPARYTVRRWHVSGVRLAVFEQLGRMLGRSVVAQQIEPRDLLDVVKPLVRFVRKLNDFSRQTKSFSPVALAVREAIVNATEPDSLLFRDLPRACGVEPFENSRKNRTRDIDPFLRALQAALTELQRGYDVLLQSVIDDICSALGVPEKETKPREHLAQRAAAVAPISLHPNIKGFITRLTDPAIDDAPWVEQLAAFLANKHPTLWHDDDRRRFSVHLAQLTEDFEAMESLTLARRHLPPEREGAESIRVAIVGTLVPRAEHVIHVDSREVEEVAELERKLIRLLETAAMNGKRRLALAALAHATCELMREDAAGQRADVGSERP